MPGGCRRRGGHETAAQAPTSARSQSLPRPPSGGKIGRVADFLRRLFRSKPEPPPRRTDEGDDDLARFFTDAEEARALFRELVQTPVLERRILVVHGAGAV